MSEGVRRAPAGDLDGICAALADAFGAVGTRSDRQRRGLATAVLAPILERAGSEGAIAFLETSAVGNLAFYERLGFAVTGAVDVLDGGPHVWATTRRAPAQPIRS